jgi:hypothetical protein
MGKEKGFALSSIRTREMRRLQIAAAMGLTPE